MPVKSTYSPRAILGDILVALSPLSTSAREATAVTTRDKLDEVGGELRKIRQGHELYLWEEEVEEEEEEE